MKEENKDSKEIEIPLLNVSESLMQLEDRLKRMIEDKYMMLDGKIVKGLRTKMEINECYTMFKKKTENSQFEKISNSFDMFKKEILEQISNCSPNIIEEKIDELVKLSLSQKADKTRLEEVENKILNFEKDFQLNLKVN